MISSEDEGGALANMLDRNPVARVRLLVEVGWGLVQFICSVVSVSVSPSFAQHALKSLLL